MPKLSVLLSWLDAHAIVLLGLVPVLVACWKAIPAAKREALERAHPRVAGLVRFVAAIAPDVLGAARIARYQVGAGLPRASVTMLELPAQPGTTVPPLKGVESGGAGGRRDPALTQTMRAIDPERGGTGLRGYSRTAAMMLVAFAVGCLVLAPLAGALLASCKLPPPDGCTPRDTRCAPDGVPEVCSSTQRWTRGSPVEPCPSSARCCRARSPYGRELHACVPPSACLPESAAVLSTPSALAGSQ